MESTLRPVAAHAPGSGAAPGLRAIRMAGVAAILIAGASVSCDRADRPASRPVPLPVRVLADSGGSERWRIATPDTPAVWLARVSRDPLPAVPAAPPHTDADPPLPEAELDSLVPETAPAPALVVDPGLVPPILRSAAPLRIPAAARGRSVELDVRVDASGAVSDVAWAGGARDSTLVAAARECALAMRFYPALLARRPVAVWCRQRFDFGRGR